MAYTWTGSSALGFDLVRRPGGAAVATVLGRGLAAGEEYTVALAGLPRASLRARLAGVAAMDAADVDRQIDLTDSEPIHSSPQKRSSERSLVAIAARVKAIRFGDGADLVDLARASLAESLTLTDQIRLAATDHLRDAVTAALVRAGSPSPDAPGRALVDEIDAAYRGLGDDLVPRPDWGPATGDILALLCAIARGELPADSPRSAQRSPAESAEWVAAMHAASWAVELSGRTRSLAAAQLRLVEVLDASGLAPDDCAGWAWNAASGMVTALIVADLLPASQVAALVKT